MIAEIPTRQPTAGQAGSRAHRRARRQGSILVEFALVAIAFYLLLAGTLEMGRMITTSQLVQNAARTAARELALMPLPATFNFDEALACPSVRARVYDPAMLVVEMPGAMPDVSNWPILNRLLVPLMIVETVGGTRYLRYPGALVLDASGALTVAVPQVVSRGTDGVETIRWVPVVEEVRPEGGAAGAGPFSLASNGPERGLVALRINCPYQASMLTAYQAQDIGAPSPTNDPILANDGGVTQLNSAPGTLVGGGEGGAYAGQYGLGKFYALKKEVRPFRRLISGQSIFRREVFSPAPVCPP